MGVELKDIEQVAEELKGRFSEFQLKNDKRLDAVEAEKGKLSGVVETLNIKLSELEKYKSDMEKELLALKRPGAHGLNPAMEEYKTAYAQYLRKGHEEGLHQLQEKAMRTTVGTDGGFAVIPEIERTVDSLLRNDNPMMDMCTVINVSTSDYKKLMNVGGASSGWVGEEDARPETNTPKLVQIQFPMGELYANPKISQTALDDMFYDAESDLAMQIATEFNEKKGLSFTSGDGVNKPKGVLAGTIVETSDATRAFGSLELVRSGHASQITADGLIKLIYTLKAGYRRSASFMMPTLTLFQVRTLKETGTGAYLWKPGLEAGQNSTLAGYGVGENEDMPALAANAYSVMFGDFKRAYYIVNRMGIRTLRDPFSAKPHVSFYTTARVGGALVDSQALKVLKIAA
ncbi:MAG TPA: phage major capsid protein [Cellvibrionaceae bacterium]